MYQYNLLFSELMNIPKIDNPVRIMLNSTTSSDYTCTIYYLVKL